MENSLDISKVIKHYRLDANVVAKVLYPNLQYPRLALDRVKKGEADLTVSQLYRLADFLGIFVQDLLAVDTWKGSGLEDDALKFEKGDYTALLKPNGMLVVRDATDVIYKGVAVANVTTIDDLLTILNKIIDDGNN